MMNIFRLKVNPQQMLKLVTLRQRFSLQTALIPFNNFFFLQQTLEKNVYL